MLASRHSAAHTTWEIFNTGKQIIIQHTGKGGFQVTRRTLIFILFFFCNLGDRSFYYFCAGGSFLSAGDVIHSGRKYLILKL